MNMDKKDRHSTERLGYRPKMKKGGAGKWNWGVGGMEDLDVPPPALNRDDPNFDEETAERMDVKK